MDYCYLIHGNLFTGDTLFIGGIGRTDLSLGDRETVNESLKKIANLLNTPSI